MMSLGDFELKDIATDNLMRLGIGDLEVNFPSVVYEKLLTEEKLFNKIYIRRLSTNDEIKQLDDFVKKDSDGAWKFTVLSQTSEQKNASLEKLEYIVAYKEKEQRDPIGLIIMNRSIDGTEYGDELIYNIALEAIYTKISERRKGVGLYLVLACVFAITEDMASLNAIYTDKDKIDIFVNSDWDSFGGKNASINLVEAIYSEKEILDLEFIEITADMGF